MQARRPPLSEKMMPQPLITRPTPGFGRSGSKPGSTRDLDRAERYDAKQKAHDEQQLVEKN